MAKRNREYIGRVTTSDGEERLLDGHAGTLNHDMALIFSTKKQAKEAFRNAKWYELKTLGTKPALRIQEITEVRDG